jgi:hypothetical protein
MYKILESFDNRYKINAVIEVVYVYEADEVLFVHIDTDANIVHVYDSLQALFECEFFENKNGDFGYDEFNVYQYRGKYFREWLKETYLD